MEHNTILLWIYLICFLQIHATPLRSLANEEIPIHSTKSSEKVSVLKQDFAKIVKRNANWSKKLSTPRDYAISSEEGRIAKGNETVEMTSKSPRIVRKMRIHQGAQKLIQGQINEEGKYISPGPKPRIKIVKVKKIRRKPSSNNTTDTPTSTTTTKISPSTTNTIKNSNYSHITVINKKVNNPKRNKKRKNRKLQTQLHTFIPYNSHAKQVDTTYATMPPEFRNSKHNAYVFDRPSSYPDFTEYFNGNQANLHQRQLFPKTDFYQNTYNVPVMNDKYFPFEPVLNRKFDPLLRMPNSARQPPHQTSSNHKISENEPVYCCSPYLREKKVETVSSANDMKVESSASNEKKLRKDYVERNSELPATTDSKMETKVTVQRSGDSSSTESTVVDEKSTTIKDEEMNQTASPVESLGPKRVHPSHHQASANPNNGYINSLHQSIPSHYPRFPYSHQDAFSDPYFADSVDLHNSPMHDENNRDFSLMTPLHQAFSPFYSRSGPQSRRFGFARNGFPYQSDEMIVPGFEHSPDLRSVRQTFMETHGHETTTSTPVTAYSLPKFEMPSIDFNNKGCQTVYKEVKTVPGQNSENREENAKSFVISRECYFPNGVPTTEQTEGYEETSTVTDIPETKSFKPEQIQKK